MKEFKDQKDSKDFEDFKDELIKEIFKQAENEFSIEQKEDSFIVKKSEKSYSQVFFHNIYRRYIDGEPIDIIVKGIFLPLISSEEDLFDMSGFVSWEQIKSQIYPHLKEKGFLGTELSKKAKLLGKQQFIPGIDLAYAIDFKDKGLMYATERHLKEWGVSLDNLHKQALENIKKSSPINKVDQNNQVFFYSNTLDGYDASRILSLDYKEIKKNFKGEVLVGIPNRDFIIVFDSQAPYTLYFMHNVGNDYSTKPYPISPYIYLWKGKEFKPLTREDILKIVPLN